MVKVWVNGCFDVLHRGHIEMFKHASSLGDILIVGIDSDEKIKEDKGVGRPFNCLADRMEILKAIKYINEVRIFNNRSELEELIKSVKPDIMVIGSDWKGKEVIGAEFSKKVEFFDRIEGYSTTNILNYDLYF